MKKFTTLLAVVLVALMLAGCSPKAPAATATPTVAPKATEEVVPEATTEAAPEATTAG